MPAIRSSDIAKLRDQWLKSVKPATVLRRFQVLSHVFNIARKEWGMESLSNPLELVRKPQPNNARTRRLFTTSGSDMVIRSELPVSAEEGTEQSPSRSARDDELERIIAATESGALPL